MKEFTSIKNHYLLIQSGGENSVFLWTLSQNAKRSCVFISVDCVSTKVPKLLKGKRLSLPRPCLMFLWSSRCNQTGSSKY